MTPAYILATASFNTYWIMGIAEGPFLTFCILWNEKTQDTELICLHYPDQFYSEVEAAVKEGKRPVAIEFCEDNEPDFDPIDLVYGIKVWFVIFTKLYC